MAQEQQLETAPDQYRAVNWTKVDGLGDDRFNVMIKDAKGFLWIGSNAKSELCRFDGEEFKKYIADPNIPGAFHAGSIWAFEEDSLHNIWIGTEKGLSRYDVRADTFSNFVAATDSVIADKSIIPFWSTNSEIYCLESGFRIVSYDVHSFKKKVLLNKTAADKHWTFPSYIILDSASYGLWILSDDADDSTRVALLNISIVDGKRKYYRWPCYRNNVIHRHTSEAMQYDRKRHSIWLNTGDGLLEFSLKDRLFHFIDAMNEFVQLINYDREVGIDVDKYGRVWIATKPKGILIYDPEKEKALELFSNPDLQQKTGVYNIQIYCDRDGIAWTSSWSNSGIYSLLPFSQPATRYNAKPGIKDSLSNGRIYSIVPGPKATIWLGTGDGLNIFDPATEKFEVLRAKDLPGIKGKAIVPLHIDSIRNIAWLNAGSPDPEKIYQMKMYEMNILTRKCRPILFMAADKKLETLTMVPEEIRPNKNGFLVSDDDYGVFQVKPGNLMGDLVIPFDKPYAIHKVVFEEERYLFLKRYLTIPNFNFEYKNGQWVKIAHPLDTMEWISMVYNVKDKTHWVGFNNELVHFDKDFRKIKSYRKEDGFASEVYNMELDDSGNLWFVNYVNQVGRLNIASDKISILSEEDGFNKQIFGWSVPIAKDARGNVYFGTGFDKLEGPGGLDRIYPEKYASPNTSAVYVRSLTINQRPFSAPVGVNSIEELSLDYDQNTMSIEPGIIDYYSKGKDHIRYKLEVAGKEKGWEYTQDKVIRFDGLLPGTYRLVIQASNANNEFNSPEKIITITIHPAFWETWWFRSFALLAGGLILYGFFQYRSRNLRRRNVELEEKVLSRTTELKHSLEELKETQSQLIQREKMASLGELTAGIAHEIQNPLNFVNNFSEVSAELVSEMKEEMKTGNSDEALNIADDIEANLQKIVHHGKRADAIVRGMLQHSRTSSGEKLPTDINALTDEYLRLSYHGMKAKDKSFVAKIHTDFDRRLSGSEPNGEKLVLVPQEIGSVLLNLFNNAFYAVSEKKKKMATLPMSKENTEHQNEYVPAVSVVTKLVFPSSGVKGIELRIRDNGTGIPKNILNKIYQPFFTTKPTGEGTGLGLSLSFDIITKMHGGEMTVDTVEGEWTEFIIALPA